MQSSRLSLISLGAPLEALIEYDDEDQSSSNFDKSSAKFGDSYSTVGSFCPSSLLDQVHNLEDVLQRNSIEKMLQRRSLITSSRSIQMNKKKKDEGKDDEEPKKKKKKKAKRKSAKPADMAALENSSSNLTISAACTPGLQHEFEDLEHVLEDKSWMVSSRAIRVSMLGTSNNDMDHIFEEDTDDEDDDDSVETLQEELEWINSVEHEVDHLHPHRDSTQGEEKDANSDSAPTAVEASDDKAMSERETVVSPVSETVSAKLSQAEANDNKEDSISSAIASCERIVSSMAKRISGVWQGSQIEEHNGENEEQSFLHSILLSESIFVVSGAVFVGALYFRKSSY